MRHQHVVEEDLVEVNFAGEIADRPHAHAGRLQVDEELAQALLLLRPFRIRLRAHQRDHHVRLVGMRGPHLLAADAPAVRRLRAARAHRGEIGPRVGLAHADAEEALAAHDGRQEALALGLGAEAQQQRPALPVSRPMGGDRRPGDEQLLGHDVALQRGALAAAIAARPGHADPAACGQLAAEGGIEHRPAVGAALGRQAGRLGAQELAHLGAQRGDAGRQLDGVKGERHQLSPSPHRRTARAVRACRPCPS